MDESIKQFETEFRQAGFLMVKSTREFLNSHGLSMSRFFVLAYVNKRSGLTMGELKNSMLLSGSSVSGLVDQLIADNMLHRERDTSDRRIVRLFLTSTGKKMVKATMDYRLEQLTDALHEVEAQNLITAKKVLHKINVALIDQLQSSPENVG